MEKIGAAYVFNLKNGDEVCIGNPKDGIFQPFVWLKRWGGECYIKLPFNLSKLSLGTKILNKIQQKLTVQVKNPLNRDLIAEFIFYQKDITEFGALEFEIKIYSPIVFQFLGNKFQFPIESKNLKFHYQPPLTEEFKPEEGEIYTETYVKTKDGIECFRPPEVVGSYAVYHATRTNIHRGREDAEKYKTGKAFHIYRPKAIDASGNEVWCDLHIDEKLGVLTITIPQDFLDNAVYPVTIDPTFGYTGVGGTSTRYMSNYIFGSKFACPESGTAQSITAYVSSSGLAVNNWKCAIYKASDNSLAGNTEELTAQYYDNPIWVTLNMANGGSLEATDYYLVFWTNDEHLYTYYDAVDTPAAYQAKSYVTGTGGWPDPWSPKAWGTKKFSIYCTYTAGGTLTEITVPDVAAGNEEISRPYRRINLIEVAASQEFFGRPYRELEISESALGQEFLQKIRNLSLGDIAVGLEILQKARQIGAITDVAQSIEQILKQRLMGLSDKAAGIETLTRPVRITVLADEALSKEILGKIRELTSITDSALGIEYVNIGAEGVPKTKIFLLIGDLAIQITGD